MPDKDVNIYRCEFFCACPNNGAVIRYALTIESTRMIQVEHVRAAVDELPPSYHEAIADLLYARFGERQTLTAHHHGVDIESKRGFVPAPPRVLAGLAREQSLLIARALRLAVAKRGPEGVGDRRRAPRAG